MEIRILKYFLAIVRENNLSKAADSLYITQPTLSRQIASLEEELGTKLFVRGKKIELTEDGKLFFRRAEEIVQMVDKTEKEFLSSGNISGEISIGTGGLLAFEFIEKILTSLKMEYPNIKFNIYTNSADFLKERLDKGLLDFGLLLEPIEIEKYDFLRMMGKERWGLLVNTESELVKKSYITSEELKNISIITTNRLSLQKEFTNWLGYDYSELNIYGNYNLLLNAVDFVLDQSANILTIEGATKLFDKKQVKFIPLYPELSMTSVLVWKKYQPMSKVSKLLLEKIKYALKA